EILEFLRFLGHSAQIKTLTDVNGLYHRRNVDYAFLIWEDLVYQVEHKNQKKSNEMYYPRFTKVIIHHFMTKKPSIPRRNRVNWHYVRDDILFSTIKVVSRHQNTQQYDAILPIKLTTEDIRSTKAYKEYYACATGEAVPKPKASARKKKGGSASSTTPPTPIATPTPTTTVVAAPRLTAATKGKQPVRARSPTEPSDGERTEAKQLKIVLRRSRHETHISQQGGFSTDEGTGSRPGEEESFDLIPRTPKDNEDDGNNEEDQGLRIGEEERISEEEEADELYRDVDINQGRGLQVNLKSAEVSDLNVRLQEKVLVITALKEQLDKLKGKAVITEAVSLNPIDPKLLKVDATPVVLKLRKNRTAHIYYIRHTQREADTLRKIVESERLLSPLNTSLDYACKYTRRIQELLVILQQTCPYITNIGTKLETVIPKNTPKQIRQTAQVIKPESITITTLPSTNLESNKPVISSIGVNLASSASESMSPYNTKNNRIRQTQKRAKKNKVEDHHRTVKSSLNKASVVDSKASTSLLNFVSNVNSNLNYASSNECFFSDNNDACVNASKKSKSVKTPVIRKIWKTTGKVFKTVGHIWKPTGRTFTLVGNVCPLTRIATPTIAPPREPIPIVNKTNKQVVTLKFLGTVKFGNDHVAKIIGYGDYQIGNVTISRVYYLEGLGHNLFSVGHFCDSDLEVAFRQHTCFIRNLEGVDLLTGSRG
nr:integrase, catalytic region, zinc finger, CCHC-type, peptidase aspartic, catalytic [Tanacetum cinerariifolium]